MLSLLLLLFLWISLKVTRICSRSGLCQEVNYYPTAGSEGLETLEQEEDSFPSREVRTKPAEHNRGKRQLLNTVPCFLEAVTEQRQLRGVTFSMPAAVMPYPIWQLYIQIHTAFSIKAFDQGSHVVDGVPATACLWVSLMDLCSAIWPGFYLVWRFLLYFVHGLLPHY